MEQKIYKTKQVIANAIIIDIASKLKWKARNKLVPNIGENSLPSLVEETRYAVAILVNKINEYAPNMIASLFHSRNIIPTIIYAIQAMINMGRYTL